MALIRDCPNPAPINPIPSSSPAFSTPIYPLRTSKPPHSIKPSILPILLPPATLRPVAFRTFTKKHGLTLTSSALQVFATFIGKTCGSGWREEGLAEKILDDAARSWKKKGGSLIVPGEGNELKDILRALEASTSVKDPSQSNIHGNHDSFDIEVRGGIHSPKEDHVILNRNDSQNSKALVSLDEHRTPEKQDPRQWLSVVNAFDQPRLAYNKNQKHFENLSDSPSVLPNASHRTNLFRHRYNIIHQRLLRNESFQTSSVVAARNDHLRHPASSTATTQQAYKLTPIANLLGRTGTNHLILGLLSMSPTGTLTLNDLTGSIGIDIQYAKPVPEDGAWFTPGMIVLVDGVYEEEGLIAGPGLESNRGVGGTIGGKLVAFSIGGPPCERREITLGVAKDATSTAGGGFGWVDFLGVGSERAAGPAMRRLEVEMFARKSAETPAQGRGRMVILGEVQLDNPMTLQALRKVLAVYAADPADQTPMVVVLIGNFVRHAVMTGGGSGGSIEYKEYFDSLANALTDYPTLLQSTTFVFVPGDNDPWPSAFSAGAATAVPRTAVPEVFTSRIKRAFTASNGEAEKTSGRRKEGEAIWTTNPSRMTLFGPSQEIVIFRDDISSRLRRSAVRFQASVAEPLSPEEINEAVDAEVQVAESHRPVSKAKVPANPGISSDLNVARKVVKTILDQAYLSPFPLSDRPVLWDYAGAMQLYPLPTALILMDTEAPPFAITYESCHVMNPGPLSPFGKRGIAQWIEYDARTRRGKTMEARF